jgi:transposase
LAFEPLLKRLKVTRRRRSARPRTRPDRLLADKAYSNRQIRAELDRHQVKATIPEKTDQQQRRAAKSSAGGRPPSCDAKACKDRNTVERAINKLKAFRAVAMRTDKREFLFRGTIDVASIKIWLRHPANQDLRDTSQVYWAIRLVPDGDHTAAAVAGDATQRPGDLLPSRFPP